MKFVQAFMIGAAALAGSFLVLPAQAGVFSPDKIQWGPAPDVLPKGAEAAVLYGDPTKEGQFALRLKLPSGYHVPPHSHPVDENITVISGTFKLGIGETADPSKVEALSAGSFFSLSPAMNHFVYADEATVIQINTVGTWDLAYVSPKDDPRKRKWLLLP